MAGTELCEQCFTEMYYVPEFPRQSIPGLQVFRNSWNANVQEVERKIANAEVNEFCYAFNS